MKSEDANQAFGAMPTLRTERLVLRPFSPADAAKVQLLAGHREIASTTYAIPNPYPDGAAEQWIASHGDAYAQGKSLSLAITLSHDGTLVGAIGFASITQKHERAEIGYWIGRPYWGNGYCGEAAKELVRFGFDELSLNRITGQYLTRNPASGAVMRKIGMRHEGTLGQHVKKWGKFEDVELYGIIKKDRHA